MLLPVIIALCLFSASAYALVTSLGFTWTNTRETPDSVSTSRPDLVIVDPLAFISIDVEWTGDLYAGEPQELVSLIVTNENPDQSIDGITMYLYLSDDGGLTTYEVIQVTLNGAQMGGSVPYGSITMMTRPNVGKYTDDPFVCPSASSYTLYVEITGLVWI